MDVLKNLLQGNLVLHQDIINSFLKNMIEEYNTINKLNITITDSFLDLTVEILAGLDAPINIKVTLSIGSFKFDRHNRFVELQVHGPVLITLLGVEIKARLGVDFAPDQVHTGAPPGLAGVLEYLDIREEKISVNFNNIPGFNQLLQKKLGFLLNHLEISKLELTGETLMIHPSIRLFQ